MNGRNVGFPPELLDMATLTKFFDFDTFDVETDNYFENTVQIKRWWAKKIYGEIKKLGEKLVKNDWRNPVLGAPAQANAYYGNQENVIVLYAGLLQVTLILLSLVFPAESFLNLSKSESLWMMGSKCNLYLTAAIYCLQIKLKHINADRLEQIYSQT